MTAESLVAINEIELAEAVEKLRALLEDTVAHYSVRVARLEAQVAVLEARHPAPE